MKKKKGFTLIELLAVIVILAIIALIAVPVIMNILNKANKSAFKDTAYGVLNAGELYFAEQQLELNEISDDVEFVWPNNLDELPIKGNVPDGTVLKVNTNGETALAMTNGRYCVTKGYLDKDVTITENSGHCYFPETLGYLSVSPDDCAAVKEANACAKATRFSIRVNNTEVKDFYVIKDTGTVVTLMMGSNLGGPVAWINEADYGSSNVSTDKGPITAINYLDGLTDDEWSNIPKRDYTYSGTGDGGGSMYEDITINMRARMFEFGESDSSASPVLDGREQFWTSTAYDDVFGYYEEDNIAIAVGGGMLVGYEVVTNASTYGVRPVIELSK